MKKKLMALILSAAASLTMIAGCGGKTENAQPAADSAPAAAAEEAPAQTEAAAEIDPKTVDYSKVDYTIEYGDSDTAKEIASNMWFGQYDGKVVKIDGIAEKLGSWSIMEEAGEGAKVGFGFELVDSEDYPADGTRVELVGVIAPGGSMEGSRILYVLPENMTPVS